MIQGIRSGHAAIKQQIEALEAENISVLEHGAVAGGSAVTNAAALVAAAGATAGVIEVPNGVFDVTATAANSETILGILDRIECRGKLNINLASGAHDYTGQIVINSPTAKNINVVGAATVDTTVTSQISVSGTAKAYSVTIGVASSAGAAVGEYAMVRADVAGTGDCDIHGGIWKITAIDSGGANRLTLLNTCQTAVFPTNTLTGGAVVILKTRINFAVCDGFRFEGGCALGLLDRLAIIGDYDIAAATGTEGTHGIVTSAPVIHGGASSNDDYDPGGQVRCGSSIGVSGFGEQGIAIAGRTSMVGNFIASCSNRKRNLYADGGNVRCKFIVTNGGNEDGQISDSGGNIQAAYSISSGNGLNGRFSTNGSMLNASNSRASNNLQAGDEARGVTRLGADLSYNSNNGTNAFRAIDGGMIDADSSTGIGSAGDNFYASSGGIIDCNNSASNDSGDWGYKSEYGGVIKAQGSTTSGNASGDYRCVDAVLFDNAGARCIDESPAEQVGAKWWNANLNHYFTVVLTSLGDMVFGSDGASRFIFRADGTLYPNADGTQLNGRAANRWDFTYSDKFMPGDGAATWTAGAGSPEGNLTAVVGSLFTRTDGGASTTLYIKETGSGNTGWIAK